MESSASLSAGLSIRLSVLRIFFTPPCESGWQVRMLQRERVFVGSLCVACGCGAGCFDGTSRGYDEVESEVESEVEEI